MKEEGKGREEMIMLVQRRNHEASSEVVAKGMKKKRWLSETF